MNIMVDGVPLLEFLPRVAVHERRAFARHLLSQIYPDLVQAFDSLPPDRLAHTVLYLIFAPESREARLAEAARRSGWHLIMVYCGQLDFDPSQYCDYHKAVHDPLLLVLVSWLYPGPLVHAFVTHGDHAIVLIAYKHCRLILSLYDTISGYKFESPQRHQYERYCIAGADGVVHRDLRIQHLCRLHGYQLPKHNLLLHDPLLPIPASCEPVRRERGSEIRVVSIGTVGVGDESILRVVQALCANQIHVHAYFGRCHVHEQHPETLQYYQLQRQSPYFHIEKRVFGEDYWRALRSYDFGFTVNDRLVFGEEFEGRTRDYIEGCGSSRVADYIAAELPIMMAPGLRFQYFWARRFASVVVPVDIDFLRNPKPLLEAALARKASQPPKDLSPITVEGVAARLGRFYAKVAAG